MLLPLKHTHCLKEPFMWKISTAVQKEVKSAILLILPKQKNDIQPQKIFYFESKVQAKQGQINQQSPQTPPPTSRGN